MMNNEVVETTEQRLVPNSTPERRAVDISGAAPVKLQTLDLARHTAIAPDNKRYVVATFDDSRIGRGIVTTVFPQQNGYLTLVRLPICEFSAEDPDEAIERHIKLVQVIQQGNLKKYLKSQQS